jgi:hypothetical protein
LATYGPLTERELKQRVNYRRAGVWVFNQALDNLLKSGEVRFLSDKRRLGLVEIRNESHISSLGDGK